MPSEKNTKETESEKLHLFPMGYIFVAVYCNTGMSVAPYHQTTA